jgi:HlyD family secretion protein
VLNHLAPKKSPIKSLAATARGLTRRADGKSWLDVIAPQSSILPDAIPFQDPIDEITETDAPQFMLGTHYFVVGMFLVVLVMAALVKVDIVVAGQGRLTTAAPPIMLQPIDRAIVKELKVKVGDVVTKGQVLATLDPTFAQADLKSLSTQQKSLIAQTRRLDAELNGQPFVADGAVNSEDALQLSLYDQRRAQYDSQIKVYDEEIQRRISNIRTTEDDRTSQSKQLVIAKDVESMRSQMLEKQVGSRLNYLDAQSARMRIEQNLLLSTNKLTELQHDLQSKQAEKQAFIDQWRHQILEELVAKRTEAAKIGEGMAKASLINDLVVLTAPEDGVVLEVARRSPGSILQAAETFITIVPSNAALVAEVMINSSDVGYTKIGDDAIIKIDAFPYQRHGFLHGRLESVSEESIQAGAASRENSLIPSERSGAFHRGMVEMTDMKLENLPPGARMFPGMTLTAEVKVGSRSVLSYFLNPITRGFSESIREP